MSSLVTPSQALEGSELQISYDTWHLGDDRAPLPHMGIIRMAGFLKWRYPKLWVWFIYRCIMEKSKMDDFFGGALCYPIFGNLQYKHETWRPFLRFVHWPESCNDDINHLVTSRIPTCGTGCKPSIHEAILSGFVVGFCFTYRVWMDILLSKMHLPQSGIQSVGYVKVWITTNCIQGLVFTDSTGC